MSAIDRRRLEHPLVGGIILFARNWADRRQLTDLCADIKRLRGDLLILVDHEGGRVQRFKTDGFTHLPPMRVLGQMWQGEAGADPQANALQAMRAATACGYVLGAELRACGVDLSFTPVLDLDYGPSGVIGDRAFAPDAAVVSVLAKSLMQGLLQSGMANCGKHFPGHGFVAADSHTDMPVDRRSLKAILAADAAPYGWLGTALASVMPAHVVYPRVDARPAGFSSRWLQDILRARLGFGGAIFSDDLSMAGARQHRRQAGQLHPGGGRRAGGRLRHGAAVQPVPGRQPGDRRLARWAHAGPACGNVVYGGVPASSVAGPCCRRRSSWTGTALMVQPLYMRSLDFIP